MKEPYRVYTGQDILTLNEDNEEPLIEDFLFKSDYIALIASDKMGKTILSQQIACSLTSGTSLLGIFDIPRPVNVWYFATEGKDHKLKERFIRMNKAVPMNSNKLSLICSSCCEFDTKRTQDWIDGMLKIYEGNLPEVIIIDPLYSSFQGDLNDNKDIKAFNMTVRRLAEYCEASVILVHHMTKPQRSQKDGMLNPRTDNDIYGSAFIKAAVDHVFWLEKWIKDSNCPKDRYLKCDTQRSGNIVTDLRLRLIEPDPLYFTVVSSHEAEKNKIRTLLKAYPQGLDITNMIKKSSIARTILYTLLKELIDLNEVEKSKTRPVIYFLRKRG